MVFSHHQSLTSYRMYDRYFLAACAFSICLFFLARWLFRQPLALQKLSRVGAFTPSAMLDIVLTPVRAATTTEDCPVCKERPLRPSRLHCGHIFCDACIRATLSQTKLCPLCQLTPFKRIHDVMETMVKESEQHTNNSFMMALVMTTATWLLASKWQSVNNLLLPLGFWYPREYYLATRFTCVCAVFWYAEFIKCQLTYRKVYRRGVFERTTRAAIQSLVVATTVTIALACDLALLADAVSIVMWYISLPLFIGSPMAQALLSKALASASGLLLWFSQTMAP